MLKLIGHWLENHRIEVYNWDLLINMRNFASNIRDPITIGQNAERLVVELIDPQVSSGSVLMDTAYLKGILFSYVC